ncbi:MAG: YjgN family protein [Gammaproteobacteria bacterium]|nr:YjgN family protein [Gammaproteobacteria bacterium]MDH5776624.1 YjgN family protein [Gammaproteobacteria bacterium]
MDEPMQAQTQTQTLPFNFTGKATEYFGIWIVNVLLIVITLGLYMPWAKVRTRRYFYGNTLLDDSPFDFTGSPIAILKGYLLAIVFFAIYYAAINVYPLSQFIFLILFLLCMPWIVVRSMIFRAHNSVFRNIRFGFKKDYMGAAKIFIGLPLLMLPTIGLIVPYLIYRQKRFFVDNSSFGTTPFSFHATAGPFYKYYAIVFLIPFIGVIAAIAIPAYHGYVTTAQSSSFINSVDDPTGVSGIIENVTILGSMLIYLLMFSYLNARINNLVWNNIEIDNNNFSSSLRARDLFWLYLSNSFVIILSFGLMVPWAKIRMARYRASKLSLLAVTDLDGFVKNEQEQVNAIGEEVGEIFDVDIGL